MSIVDRVKNILLSPKTEWDVIAKEDATVGGLFTGYACILALIPAIMSIIFLGALGMGGLGMGEAGALIGAMGMSYFVATAVVGYVLGLFCIWVVALIVKTISSSFNGKEDMVQATKLMVYSGTPVWVAGLVSWIPVIGWLVGFGAMAYAVYLIYLGVKPVMGVPDDKVAGMTVVTVLVYVVTSLVLSMVIGAAIVTMFLGGAMMGGLN
jgi:Yip1 domain